MKWEKNTLQPTTTLSRNLFKFMLMQKWGECKIYNSKWIQFHGWLLCRLVCNKNVVLRIRFMRRITYKKILYLMNYGWLDKIFLRTILWIVTNKSQIDSAEYANRDPKKSDLIFFKLLFWQPKDKKTLTCINIDW